MPPRTSELLDAQGFAIVTDVLPAEQIEELKAADARGSVTYCDFLPLFRSQLMYISLQRLLTRAAR